MTTTLITNSLLLLAMAAGLYVGLMARAEHKRNVDRQRMLSRRHYR